MAVNSGTKGQVVGESGYVYLGKSEGKIYIKEKLICLYWICSDWMVRLPW